MRAFFGWYAFLPISMVASDLKGVGDRSLYGPISTAYGDEERKVWSSGRGDVRFGGLYDLVEISREYDSDRIIARFAVVQRRRMEAVGYTLWNQGMWPVAGLVFFTTFLAPAAVLAIMIHILLALKRGRIPAGFTLVMRLLQHFNPWGMVEVFIIGVIVALVKLTHYGTLIPGIALWSLGVLTLLMTATASSFNVHDIWNRVHAAPRQRGTR